ncbi:MAG: two-component regulator propeller domain-containing protein [Owenweeksia sp.]
MKKITGAVLALTLVFTISKAQTADRIGVWVDHLPYGAGVDMIIKGDELYCAVEQGLFILNTKDRDIQRLSKLNGLNDVNVTALALSEETGEVIIGYENANIDLLNGGEVVNIPDISLSANYPGLKSINHLFPYENLVYISTNFGIVVMDLDRRIIKETYIIGENGENLQVNQVVINPLNDSIFAATEKGVFKAKRGNALQFFANWKRDERMRTAIKQITFLENTIYINKGFFPTSDSVFYREDNQWKYAEGIPPSAYDFMKESNGYLVLTNTFSALGFQREGSTHSLKFNVNQVFVDYEDYNPVAGIVGEEGSDVFWSLDERRALYLNFGTYNENIFPNSPASKKVYQMHNNGNRVFVAPGEINETWQGQFNNAGFYILEAERFVWENFAREEIGGLFDILAVISDEEDNSHFFVSAYDSCIAEFRNDQLVRLISQKSEGKNLFPGISGSSRHRVGDFSHGIDGDVWFTNSLTDRPLGVIHDDGSVESFGLGSAVSSAVAVKNIMFTTEEQIWIQTRTAGIVVAKFINDSLRTQKMQASENLGNLPTETVLCFAEDKDGEVWIGTNEGVAVLYSPRNLFEPNRNYDAQRIIIDDDGDGLGDPFLGGESVNDIEVDGSNKKWFATANSGVFYTSDDGREEIYHFTKENSPLLSNNVLDIEIDDESGMVYFGTDQGIVSFQGVATEGSDFNEDVFAYPNPVKPGYTGPILIRGLVTNAQVKITDVEGNIVYETVAEGGQAIWSGRKFDGNRVKTGVYLAYVTDELGTTTAITKILIVN